MAATTRGSVGSTSVAKLAANVPVASDQVFVEIPTGHLEGSLD